MNYSIKLTSKQEFQPNIFQLKRITQNKFLTLKKKLFGLWLLITIICLSLIPIYSGNVIDYIDKFYFNK